MHVVDREPICVAMAIAAETIYSGSFGTNIFLLLQLDQLPIAKAQRC
jgi:hypothetical protein